MPKIALGRAVTVLLILAVLLTAALVHLIWQRTAMANIERVVTTLDTQSVGAVRTDLTRTLTSAEGTAEIVRAVLSQGVISAAADEKRERLLLSLLRAQPSVAWIGLGFPDERFFGVHTAGGKIETIEIGTAEAGKPKPVRRDIYRLLAGDMTLEERIFGETAYVPGDALWYRTGTDTVAPAWSVAGMLPSGFEPSLVVSKRVELDGKFEGVVMVAVSLTRLADTLRALDMAGNGKGFVLARNGMVLATSEPGDKVMAAHLSDFPTTDMLAGAVASAIASMGAGEFRTMTDSQALGPVYVSSSILPFEDWRLLTAIPRSVFAVESDRNTQRVLFVVIGLAVLGASAAILFANLLFTRPLGRLAAQLREIERFSLADVRYVPSFLSELSDLSQTLKRMAGGLSAFAKYMPLEVVRPLVSGGVEPKPGGKLTEITVMFADLPGFTELTERLGPDVEPHLTSFLTLAVTAIHAEGGTVDKFIGDSVMAIWNAPNDVPDHAACACRAAAAIRAAMHLLPTIAPGQSAVRVRIGINTGVALVGNVGSEERLSYTAIGDTVNIASRLVGIAKEHGVELVLSEMTVSRLGGCFATRPLGIATVRGRAAPVAIHTVA